MLGSNGLLVVCADQAHNLYGFLFEPTFEMVPCQGRTKDDVMKFTCPVRVKRPVAPVKRPVPPVTIAVSWLSNTLGVAVGVRYPEKGAGDLVAVGRNPMKEASVG